VKEVISEVRVGHRRLARRSSELTMLLSVAAFAAGDKPRLRPLLGDEVYKAFGLVPLTDTVPEPEQPVWCR